MTFSNLMKMAEKATNGLKTLWGKEKLLVTSNFSFTYSVFKRLVLQTRKNQGLFGKGSIFKFDENGRKGYKQVENTVGKGEIARYE